MLFTTNLKEKGGASKQLNQNKIIADKALQGAKVKAIQKDTDGDGLNDLEDAFPTDPFEQEDADNDGLGNNMDTDDDNDGLSDLEELAIGCDPLSDDSDDDGTLTIIDNSNYSFKQFFNGDCNVFYFGVFNENYEYGWNIIVNEYNILVLDKFDVDDNVIARSTSIPSEDGNVLTETYEDYSDNSEYVLYTNRTTLTDPCE